MATTYSDFYNSVQTVEDGVGTSTILLASTAAAQAVDKTWTPRSGVGGGRVKTITAQSVIATIGGTSADIVRMFTLPSSARILELNACSEGTSTTYAADIGVYESGDAHDGALIDIDLFDAGSALATAQAYIDSFALGVLTDVDRGRPLWHLCALGAATYTADPQIEMDICLTSSATLITVIETVTLVCLYTSG